MRRLPASKSTGAFHRDGVGSSSLKITREFHCSRLVLLLLPGLSLLLVHITARDRERERLFRCSISANDADDNVSVSGAQLRAQPRVGSYHPIFHRAASVRWYRVPDCSNVIRACRCGKISFPLSQRHSFPRKHWNTPLSCLLPCFPPLLPTRYAPGGAFRIEWDAKHSRFGAREMFLWTLLAHS